MSCVNYSYTPDFVSRSDAQKQQYDVLGTIKDITNLSIEGNRESDIASSGGSGQVGSNLTKKDAVELLIEIDEGKLISIIQEISSYNYSKNQRVRIIKRNGKSRVVPFE